VISVLAEKTKAVVLSRFKREATFSKFVNSKVFVVPGPADGAPRRGSLSDSQLKGRHEGVRAG
jgi:hypothetical protein